MTETPDIRRSTYAASAFSLAADQAQGLAAQSHLGGQNQMLRGQHLAANQVAVAVQHRLEEVMPPAPTTARRLVQVFIIDPYESVPLDQCLLYKGEMKLTDLTDQELFYEIDIKAILDAHNKKRVEITDKKVKERIEKLEPARIRDLRMQIVTVAQF